jgi:hypothetical protein
MHGYHTWVFHGEDSVEPLAPHLSPQPEHVGRSESQIQPEELADSDEMDQMLLDNFGMYDTGVLGNQEDGDSADDEDEEDSNTDDVTADAEAYRKLVEDGSQDLYVGCTSFSKLQFIVRLLNLKNTWKVPNGCYDEILSLFKEALPQPHALSGIKNLHASKRYIKDIGIGYESIHACKNDCIMFRGAHKDDTVCPICNTSRWKSENTGVGGKRMYMVPQKVIRHFKLKPMVRRLFMCSKTAPYMTWHSKGRTKDAKLRHPADSPAWKHFDFTHRKFSEDPRNIRFALATDGFNPFENMSISYSIWPVILIPLNLPPWVCMKQSNFILSVIVPGRKGPGKELDVYMQLAIDDLQELWKPGIWTHDAVTGEKFLLRAALLWTITDWLGRGCISGESLVVCAHCLTNTCSRWLKHCKKTVFLSHRRFLVDGHPYRTDGASFNGKDELRDPPAKITGQEISEMTATLHTEYGKLKKHKKPPRRKKRSAAELEENEDIYIHSVEETFKKRSVFFQLEYWPTLLVRHNLDIMHVQQNVFEKIVNTILDVDQRSKDNLNARLDLQDMNIRTALHADMTAAKPIIPRAVYQMLPQGKNIFCTVIKYATFPDGYASNLYHKVNLEDKRLTGLKSHDCHIIMQDLMPLALCRSLPRSVAMPLIRFCKYFKVLYGKVIDADEMEHWEAEIAEILCQLEMIFPPSFFDMMVHVTIHLASEVRIAGPVQFRDMWSTERFVGTLKDFVQNMTYPEGSLAENYQFDECLTFCSRYLNGCATKFNRPSRHDSTEPNSAGQPYLRIIGRPLSGFASSQLDFVAWSQAQRCVLVNYPDIEKYAQ